MVADWLLGNSMELHHLQRILGNPCCCFTLSSKARKANDSILTGSLNAPPVSYMQVLCFRCRFSSVLFRPPDCFSRVLGQLDRLRAEPGLETRSSRVGIHSRSKGFPSEAASSSSGGGGGGSQRSLRRSCTVGGELERRDGRGRWRLVLQLQGSQKV